MERKIGEIFLYQDTTYKAVLREEGCKGCAFNHDTCTKPPGGFGSCYHTFRKDNRDILFKEITDMKIKDNQLTIEIPEGMEIDLENTDLKNGIIKFKKKEIDYIDVCISLNTADKSIIVSDTNCKKIKAISQLMDIAKYYNKDWKPNWSNSKENKYCIKFDYHKNRFYVDYNNSIGAGDVFFKNSEDARAVINNPNFKNILNTIYKN